MTRVKQQIIPFAVTLTFAPFFALAETNTRDTLADQIEALSLDQAPEEPLGEGVGWVLYPPLVTHWRQMAIEGCTLTLQSFDAENVLQRSLPIDLSIARLMHFENGEPYEFFPLIDPEDAFNRDAPEIGSAGLLRFSMPNHEPILGQLRDEPSEGEPGRLIAQQFYDPAYAMRQNPSRETVAALAASILTYQQQVCQPLG